MGAQEIRGAGVIQKAGDDRERWEGRYYVKSQGIMRYFNIEKGLKRDSQEKVVEADREKYGKRTCGRPCCSRPYPL